MHRAVAVAAVLVVSLTGCTQAPPPVDFESSAPPAAPPAVVAASGIGVSPTGIEIFYDDSTSLEFAYSSDPADVVEALTTALGAAPSVSRSEELVCQPSFDNASWPGISVKSAFANLPDGQKFAVTIEADRSGDVPLSTSDGISVGSSAEQALATLDGEQLDRKTDAGVDYDTVFWGIQPGGDWGGYLFAAADKVVTIIAAVQYDTLTC